MANVLPHLLDCPLGGGGNACLDYAVTVCIPWRAQPSRVEPYRKVRQFWDRTGWPVIEGDSEPGERFNASQARNNAVRQVGTEFVVIADADVIPDLYNILYALDGLGEEIVWPYTRHRYIANDWQGDPFDAPAVQLDGMPPQPQEGYIEWTGGVYVARPESYWHVGGFDERFRTWGGEDTCFRIAANTMVGVGRVEGAVVSFNHECPGRNGSAVEGGTNAELLQRYRSAELRPLEMLKLTRDPARFL